MERLAGAADTDKGILFYFTDGVKSWLPNRVFGGEAERGSVPEVLRGRTALEARGIKSFARRSEVAERHDTRLEIKVRLPVMNFECPSDEVSDILGVQPSETWTKGQRVTAQATNVHHQNGWMLRSPADPMATTLEEAIGALLSLFPDKTAFARLRRDPRYSSLALCLPTRKEPSSVFPPRF